ncbi:MAG TPA: TIGR01777 family oxidoreductase [Microlunatus sp.]
MAGASGFLGTALRVRLASEGHEVVRLVRREPGSATEFEWDPDAGTIADSVLDDVDAVVNLCGVGIADRPLTTKRKEIVRSSRINSTRTLAGALVARLALTGSAPALLQASATGYYPTEGSEQPLTEDQGPGPAWIAQVVAEWEATAQPAADAGVRVVWLRTSPVIDSSGGLFPVMKRAWSLGAGAKLGDGTQHMPLIQLDDYVRFVLWAAEHPEASGPYNLTLPRPTTNSEFTDELAAQLHRPRFLRAPNAVLRTVLGDFADQLLGDVWLLPQQALAQGFEFRSPDAVTAIKSALRN